MSQRDSHPRDSERDDVCWICQRGEFGDEERLRDPHTGDWAHVRCVNRTIAGAGWRLGLARRDLVEAVLSSFRRRRRP